MAELTIEQALNLAWQCRGSSQLQQAEQLCRQVLSVIPDQVDALYILSQVAMQMGRVDEAMALIRRACSRQPHNAAMLVTLANFCMSAGRWADAASAFSDSLAVNSAQPQCLCGRGIALKQLGRLDEAIASYKAAIALRPDFAEAYCNLGSALHTKGNVPEAIGANQRAVALQPAMAEAHFNLGLAFHTAGRLDESVAAYQLAIDLRPDYAEAHSNFGNALLDRNDIKGAIAAQQRAIESRPGFARAHLNLGNALKSSGDIDGAIAAYQRAIAMKDDYAEAFSNLGVALREKGDVDQAIVAYRRAIALKPDIPQTHANLGWCLLVKGDPLGWAEHEWRLRCHGEVLQPRSFTPPRWDGQALNGATILIHAEQGLGDTLQFVRYLPLVEQRGGRVILECQPELSRLMRQSFPECQIVAAGQEPADFDFHCPLLSLAYIFQTTNETIPQQTPYVRPEPADVEAWRNRLAQGARRFTVGLYWAGNPLQENDHNRSMSLEHLAGLGQVANVRFIGLQKGVAGLQARTPPAGMELLDFAGELRDMADTAALIENLDLVIGIDTSVAHLTGALGKPLWTMLSVFADWRYLQSRQDSPWYPTMTLFRQPAPGDWKSVVDRVIEKLSLAAQDFRRE